MEFSDATLLLKTAEVETSRLAQAVGQPLLVLDDMMEDLLKVAISVATTYTDNSCFALNFNDLKAECLKKVVDVIKAGWLNRARNRVEFFKIAKTAMNNHVKGIVQRHRFTIKRTGHRAPDRNDPTAVNIKPDVSLDDPDVHLQVSSTEDTSCSFDQELLEDLKVFLTPLELLVLEQLADPNPGAYMFSYLGTARGRKKNEPLSVKLSHQHMAEGLGISIELFAELHQSIKQKYVEKIMNNKPEDVRFNSALSTLENIFGVQIPRSTDRVIVARLFTICARDQLEKVNGDVGTLLSIVGAKPPQMDGDRLSCFGVLFQKNNRTCTSCGLRTACQTEALNYGLGEITLSPKLLGSRNVRTPVLTDQQPSIDSTMSKPSASDLPASPAPENKPAPTPASGPFTPTERDEALLVHLRDKYKQIKFGVDTYYAHKDGKPKCVFYIGKEGEPFELRFCKPSEVIKKILVRKVRSFYLPPEMTAEDAIKIIDQHADETFQKE
jgi:6-pyruvoyl-tetrahydropterin synthase